MTVLKQAGKLNIYFPLYTNVVSFRRILTENTDQDMDIDEMNWMVSLFMLINKNVYWKTIFILLANSEIGLSPPGMLSCTYPDPDFKSDKMCTSYSVKIGLCMRSTGRQYSGAAPAILQTSLWVAPMIVTTGAGMWLQLLCGVTLTFKLICKD